MFKFIDKISLLGVYATQDPREQNRITIMNLFFGFCGFVAIVFVVASAYHSLSLLEQVIFFITGLVFLSILFLHQYHHYRVALFIGIISSGLAVATMCLLNDYENGFYCYFFATPLMILSFYSMRNKTVVAIMILYYASLIMATYYWHIKTVTEHHDVIKHSILFPTNATISILVIILLSYNFWKSNSNYAKYIEHKNRELKEKNEENLLLMSDLHDKVKNNIQNMTILAEADNFFKRQYTIDEQRELYSLRIRTMDICHKMVYEQQLSGNQWFKFFFDEYILLHNKYVSAKSGLIINFTNKITDTNPLNRKRFDNFALLINEICFQLMQPFDSEFRIKNVEISSSIDENKNTSIKMVFSHFIKLPVFCLSTIQFAKTQRVEMASELSPNNVFSITLTIPYI